MFNCDTDYYCNNHMTKKLEMFSNCGNKVMNLKLWRQKFFHCKKIVESSEIFFNPDTIFGIHPHRNFS